MIRTRSPSGSAAATSRALEDGRAAAAPGAGRRRAGPDDPIGSGSGSSARPARWSASSMLAASRSTSGTPPLAATSSRRTLAAVDACVAQDGVGDVVGHDVERDDGAGVGVAVGARPPAGDDRQSFELQPPGDVGQRPARRHVDPVEVVDEDDDRRLLGGVDQEVTGGEGDGERFDRLLRALQRRARRARPRRGPGRAGRSRRARRRAARRGPTRRARARPRRRAGAGSASRAGRRARARPPRRGRRSCRCPASPTTVSAPPWPAAAPAASPAMASTTS